MNASGFCYDNFGRTFAPESRDAWASKAFFLRRKKEGVVGPAGRLASGGIAAVITENKTILSGVFLPRGYAPEVEVVCSELSPSALMVQTLFDPPKGEWVGINFSNRALSPEKLHLNVSRREVCFSEDSGDTKLCIRHDIFERAADLWGDTPARKLYAARDELVARLAGAGVPKNNIVPDARKAVKLLTEYDQNLGLFIRYLDWRKTRV